MVIVISILVISILGISMLRHLLNTYLTHMVQGKVIYGTGVTFLVHHSKCRKKNPESGLGPFE